MAKAKAVRAALQARKAAQASKAAKGGGLIKSGLTAGAASAVTRAFNNQDQQLEQSAENSSAVISASVEKPISKPKVSSTSEIPQATLAFTDYVKNQTERVESVRAVGKPLPELVISRKFSPIMKNIIENINGIKKRLERVEIKTHKQTRVLLNLKSAAMGLNDTVKDSLDDQRRDELEEKRQADEEDIERRGIGEFARDVFRPLIDFTKRQKDRLLAVLLPFLTPAALFGTSFALEQASEYVPDMTFEEVLDIVDTVEEKVASIVAGLSGLASGQALGRGAQSAAQMVQRMRGIERSAAVAQQVVSKIDPASGKYARFLGALQKAQGFFARLSKMTGSIGAQASKWLSGLGATGADLLKKLGRKVLKWYLIFEAFGIMANAVQLLILGAIDEAEFHRRTKEQIAEIIRVLGGPYIVMLLFGLLGTVVPILGNAVGAIAGLIAGLILGDTVFNILKLETLSNGLYDWIFLDDTTTLKTFPGALLTGLTRELPKLLAAKIAESYERVTQFADSFIQDRMATEEEIKSEYGEGTSDLDILKQASEGLGTDENAILYAFRNIKTIGDYLTFANKFEEEFLPEYNKDRMFGKVNSMEEYLKKELLTDEYEKLINQIRTQIAESGTTTQEKLSQFIRETTGVDDRPQIPNYGGVTEEEFKMWKAGQIVAVTTKTGGRKLMTEEQILTSEEVGIAARESALERLERNRKIAEAQGITYMPEQNQETNVVPVTRDQSKPNIIVMPPPPSISRTPQNNLAGTEGPIEFSSPDPSRLINDSFVDLSYLT